ncbi:uncharacterized protein LOC113333562 [Papaver somniferum]|uniref:uncharacterized protein LOC113333562 n=1 Tax=Papaver somniferum TaxID=3469 RepID=UPI000E6FAF22|nr:uncharacterized protein LOC113333562 [Papaver somniferum]
MKSFQLINKNGRLRQTRLATEDKIRPRVDGVASDLDVEEAKSVWEPVEHNVKPYPPKDDYLDAMNDDTEDHMEEVHDKNFEDGSEEEFDEDFLEDGSCRDSDESDD